MKTSIQALAIALAALAVSAPASAQYGAPPPQPSQDQGGYQGRQEQAAVVIARAEKADGQGQQCRAEKRRGRHNPDLDRSEPEAKQIDRQQDCDKAIAEVAQRPRAQQVVDGTHGLGGGTERVHATPLASRRRLVAELGRKASWDSGESAGVPGCSKLTESSSSSQASARPTDCGSPRKIPLIDVSESRLQCNKYSIQA